MADRNLARIAALLRQAEGTANEHEADAYLQAAQRLATLASVDLAVARAHTADRERRETPIQRCVGIGAAGKRGLRSYVRLFLVIAQCNGLICDIARNSTSVYAFGYAADIDATEAMYASLVVQMVRASDQFVKSGDYAREQVERLVRVPTTTFWGRPGTTLVRQRRPVHPTTARISFQEAFARRIGLRLEEAAASAEAESSRPGSAEAVLAAPGGSAEPAAAAGVALALRQRELEVRAHHRAHSAARGTWAGSRPTAPRAALAGRAGDDAGRRARMGPDREIGGARRALP